MWAFLLHMEKCGGIMQLNDLEQQRVDKLNRLLEAGYEAYPRRSFRSHSIAQAISEYMASEETSTDAPVVTIAGRLISNRVMGKIAFAHVEDESGRIQLFLRRDEIGEETYQIFRKTFDLGDFVEAEGPVVRTRTGEISVQVTQLRMLAKAITPLPIAKEYEDNAGNITRNSAFSDIEERYRQRYADLAVNANVRDVFRIRSRLHPYNGLR